MADGTLRMIYFHFPVIDQESAVLAEISDCAGEQGAETFWNTVEILYQNQGNLNPSNLHNWIPNTKSDPDVIEGCLQSGRHAATWQIDRAYGQALGVNSTPTIFIKYIDKENQEVVLKFNGAQEYGRMQQLLDAILQRIQ